MPDAVTAADLATLSWLRSPAAFATHVSRHRLQGGDERIRPWNNRPHLALVSSALRDMTFGRIRRLMINVPPQAGKSSIVGLWWPAWMHELHARGALDGNLDVLHATYNDTYGRSWGRRSRMIIESNPDILRARLAPGSSAAGEWGTMSGSTHVAGGLAGTGRPARYLIIDDPIHMQNILHPNARDDAWNWWLETGLPRLAPNSGVVVVATRGHEDDFPGRLLSNEREGNPDEWTVLKIPAVAEDTDDPLGRVPGQPLYRPDVEQSADEALAFWRGVQDVSEYLFLSQYQQRPTTPRGTVFLREAWARHEPDERFEGWSWLTTVDCAFKATDDSSFVVVAVVAYEPRGVQPRRAVVDLLRGRFDFRQTKLAVRAAAQAWPQASPRLVESKANGPAVVNDLRAVVAGLEEFSPDRYGSKQARAWACQGEQNSGRVSIPRAGTEQPRMLAEFRSLCAAEGVEIPANLYADWTPAFVDELAGFPTAAHNDQVDAFTQAILWMRANPEVAVSVSTGTKRRLEGVRRY